MANNDSGGSFAVGFLVGGIIGAVVGILLAPRPGSETRAELLDRSEAWRAKAEELAASVREGVGPAVEGMRDRVGPAVENVRDRVGPAVESVRDRVGPVVGQVSSRIGHSGDSPEVELDLEIAPTAGEDGKRSPAEAEQA